MILCIATVGLFLVQKVDTSGGEIRHTEIRTNSNATVNGSVKQSEEDEDQISDLKIIKEKRFITNRFSFGGNLLKNYRLISFAFSLIISLILRFSILLSSQEIISRYKNALFS